MSDHTNANGKQPDDGFTGNAVGKSSRGSDRGMSRICDGDGWWEDRTIAQKVLIGIGIGILIVGGLFLLGFITMHLWNWLMPEIFGLPQVTYWQTWGLMILSFILLKNWGSGESSGRKDRKRKRHLRRYMQEDQTPLSDVPEDSSGASESPSGA